MNKKEKAPHARELLAANLLVLRNGEPQEILADRAGFHRTYISHLERQLANVTIDNLQKLADVLEVPVARLFELPKKD